MKPECRSWCDTGSVAETNPRQWRPRLLDVLRAVGVRAAGKCQALGKYFLVTFGVNCLQTPHFSRGYVGERAPDGRNRFTLTYSKTGARATLVVATAALVLPAAGPPPPFLYTSQKCRGHLKFMIMPSAHCLTAGFFVRKAMWFVLS